MWSEIKFRITSKTDLEGIAISLAWDSGMECRTDRFRDNTLIKVRSFDISVGTYATWDILLIPTEEEFKINVHQSRYEILWHRGQYHQHQLDLGLYRNSLNHFLSSGIDQRFEKKKNHQDLERTYLLQSHEYLFVGNDRNQGIRFPIIWLSHSELCVTHMWTNHGPEERRNSNRDR